MDALQNNSLTLAFHFPFLDFYREVAPESLQNLLRNMRTRWRCVEDVISSALNEVLHAN